MEKADVLELAVRHLRDVNRTRLNVAASADPTVLDKYRVGFSECASEIGRYLNQVDGMEVDLRGRLLGHLSNCMTGLKHDQDCRPRPFMSMIPNPAVIQQQQMHAQSQYQNIVHAHMMQQQPMKTSPTMNMQMTVLPQPIANGHRAMHLNTMQNGPLPSVPHGQQHLPGGVLVAKPAHEVQLSPIFVNTHSPKDVIYADNLVKQVSHYARQPQTVSPPKHISPSKPESGLLKIDTATLNHKSLSVSPPPSHLLDATRVRDEKVWRPW
ncbi:transcription factor HES-1-like isoform X2 [Lineus longissimus]